MYIRAAIDRNVKTCIIRLLICLLLAVSVLACSGGGGSSSPNSSSSGTGGIAFGLAWKGSAASNVQQGPVSTVCGSGPGQVSTITAYIYNDSVNGLVAKGGPWACTAGSGTISGITPGDGYYVQIGGLDSGSNIAYLGSVYGISVKAAQVSNAGVVPMYNTSDLQSLDLLPFNESMDMSSVQPLTVIGTFYDPSTQNNYQLDITNWARCSTSDPSIATIGSNGLLQPLTLGIVDIACTLGSSTTGPIPPVVIEAATGPSGGPYYTASGTLRCGTGTEGRVELSCDPLGSYAYTTGGIYTFSKLQKGVTYTIKVVTPGLNCSPCSVSVTPTTANFVDLDFSCCHFTTPMTTPGICGVWNMTATDASGTCSWETYPFSYSAPAQMTGTTTGVSGSYTYSGNSGTITSSTTTLTYSSTCGTTVPWVKFTGLIPSGCKRTITCNNLVISPDLLSFIDDDCTFADTGCATPCTGSTAVAGSLNPGSACNAVNVTIATTDLSSNGGYCVKADGGPCVTSILNTVTSFSEPAGPYTITASKSGYNCTPVTGTMPTPPLAQSATITCTPVPPPCLAGNYCACPNYTDFSSCKAACSPSLAFPVAETSKGVISNPTTISAVVSVPPYTLDTNMKCADSKGGLNSYTGNVSGTPTSPIIDDLHADLNFCWDSTKKYAGYEILDCPAPTVVEYSISPPLYYLSATCDYKYSFESPQGSGIFTTHDYPGIPFIWVEESSSSCP